MLTMADKGGREGLDPPFLADIICGQPLVRDLFLFGPIGSLASVSSQSFL